MKFKKELSIKVLFFSEMSNIKDEWTYYGFILLHYLQIMYFIFKICYSIKKYFMDSRLHGNDIGCVEIN